MQCPGVSLNVLRDRYQMTDSQQADSAEGSHSGTVVV